MMNMVYVVTFRTDAKAPQQELKRYTKESANAFATGIIDIGGVAIVTEDIEDIPEQKNDDLSTDQKNPRNSNGLIWSDN